MGLNGNISADYASIVGKVRAFTVDNTLTISGACADAKATGDAIKKMDTATALAKAEEAKTTAANAVTTANGAVNTANDTKSKFEALGPVAKIKVEYYEGTGATANIQLGCEFAPKFVVISKAVGGMGLGLNYVAEMCTLIRGVSSFKVSDNNSKPCYIDITWRDDGITWTGRGTNVSADVCYNASGEKYYYAIFG